LSERIRRLSALLQRHQWQLLIAFALLNALLRNASTPLWDQDEAAYAGFARHMIQSGDWVVPDFMWSEPHRKPQFLIWTIAASFKLFGESEFALRLPTVFATLATYFALWRLGSAVLGERTSRLAALVLATSMFVPNLAKIAFTDSWLLLFETLAALSLFHALQTPGWRWTLLFWASVALGLLTKGPPILILAGGLGFWLLLVHPQRGRLLRLHPWFGLPLAFLPLLVWGRLAWMRTNGDLIRWMLDWYVFQRAKGGVVFGQIGPPGYHLLVLFIGFLPWSTFLWSALLRLRERWRDPTGRFLIGWVIFGWLVWEVMLSKLPAYAIGAYPVVALLLAEELIQFEASGWARKSVRVGFTTAVLLGTALSFAGVIGTVRFHLGNAAFVCACALLAIFFAGTMALFAALLRGERLRLVGTLALGGLMTSFLLWAGIFPAVDQYRGLTRTMAQEISKVAPPKATIVYGHNFRLPSLPFYVGRSPVQQTMILGDAALVSRYGANTNDVFVLPDDIYQRLSAQHPFKVAHRVDGWVVDGPKQVTYWIAMKDEPTKVAQP
jgi:4-amino-4-deoxy-L-arabinose transferase-like glycosyltransferase